MGGMWTHHQMHSIPLRIRDQYTIIPSNILPGYSQPAAKCSPPCHFPGAHARRHECSHTNKHTWILKHFSFHHASLVYSAYVLSPKREAACAGSETDWMWWFGIAAMEKMIKLVPRRDNSKGRGWIRMGCVLPKYHKKEKKTSIWWYLIILLPIRNNYWCNGRKKKYFI